MDDPAIFLAFLVRLPLPVQRQRTAITTHLATTFSDLTSLTEKDIDSFVTNTGIRNRSLANNQAVVLPDQIGLI